MQYSTYYQICCREKSVKLNKLFILVKTANPVIFILILLKLFVLKCVIVVQHQCVTIWAIFQLNHSEKWNDNILFGLDQNAELDFYSASSLIQQSAGRYVTPPTPSLPVFALTPWWYMLSRDATDSNLIVWFDQMIYHTRSELVNHYTTNGAKWLYGPLNVNTIEFWLVVM